MLTHGNLLHNLESITGLFAIPEGARSVSWLPPYHDLGLIGQILLPLYRRMPTLLMPPESFLQRPLRWLEAITRFEATLSGGPNFAYDLCVRKIKEDDRRRLDLRSWRMAFNAAEPVRPETLARFSRAFAPCGFDATAFRPCYGMAEATLVVSFGTPQTAPVVRAFQPEALAQGRAVPVPDPDAAARTLVGCGRSAPDQVIAIVDPDSRRRCAEGEVGEIWACGASVAAGYWRKPEASADAFEGRIADSDEGPFLRTGDLGFLDAGELFVLGRLKDLIVVYGRKHHAEDIEQTVGASHGALRPGCGAAFGIEHDGQERLIVAHEVRGDVGSDREIFGAICGAVRDEHGLDVHAIVLLRPGAILKTSSGKVRRRASKAAFLQGTLNGLASWSR
jgi:acyl-CoA synthetase (AMP-forming)/AMP-acid ligase II